jgi:hypothetical protein
MENVNLIKKIMILNIAKKLILVNAIIVSMDMN